MRISVITPTRDRARLLPAVCASLAAQDVPPLEWIVVDDGSTDGTQEVVRSLEAPFPVVYARREPLGKHLAVNHGVRIARGEFAALLDSDDRLLEGGLARLLEAWDKIPETRREEFVGVTGRCVSDRGPLGNPVPGGVLDATWQAAHYRHGLSGERFGILRADVLRRYPFPDRPGFVVEGQVWRAIGRGYLTRYIEDPVKWHNLGEPDSITRKPYAEVVDAIFEEHRSVLTQDLRWCPHAPALFARSAAHCVRAAVHLGVRRLRGRERQAV